MIDDKWYRVLKLLVQLLLPAAGTLYFLVIGPDPILGVLLTVDLVLGTILLFMQREYASHIGLGDLIVERDEEGIEGLRLALDHTPEELAGKYEVRFKVKREPPPLKAVS